MSASEQRSTDSVEDVFSQQHNRDGAPEVHTTNRFAVATLESTPETEASVNEISGITQVDGENLLVEASTPEFSSNSVLTLDDLKQIALANNPTLPQASSEIEKERGVWQQVGLYPNPTVGYLNSSSSRNGESQVNGVLAQQTFITAGKLEKARAAQSFGVQDALWEQEAQKHRILNDVQLRYFDVLAAQEQIQIAVELSGLSQQVLEAAHKLYNGGQVPKTDVLQAEIQRQQIDVAHKNAQVEYQSAWNRLAAIIGCPEMVAVPLAEPPADLPNFDLESEWQRLLAESPQLKGVQSQVGLARAQWTAASAAPIPDVTVQVVSQYDSIGGYGTFSSLIALPLPIYNRNQGGIHNAAHEYSRSQLEVQRVCLVLRDQLVTSYGNYMLAKNQSEKLRTEVLPRIKENLELTLVGYQQGEYGYLAVLNAQQSSYNEHLNYINAVTQARHLAVSIEGLQLSGGLNPAEIGTAIQDVGTGGRLQAVQAQQNRDNASSLGTFAPAAMN
ncbi:TolC family protein [Planctomicrobium sp. SH527]|uniref:TolC family protein n=1 Tax=Planctomicrobium sp. SH527 TaxID=3448123 RepID=UPI003F5C491A